jgi:hypothetical protein
MEWDVQGDRIVLASGWNDYFLKYDGEAELRTAGETRSGDGWIGIATSSLDVVPTLAAPSGAESLGIIREWLDKCLSEHTH